MTLRDGSRGDFAGATAIVTGGAGFIGSHLVEGLLAAGADRVDVVDDLSLGRLSNLDAVADSPQTSFARVDCCDLDALTGALGRDRYDYCFNLAVIPLPHSLGAPRENVDRNVAMTTAVCELGRAGGYRRLVQYSSSEVYGTALAAPMPETHPLLPHTPYAASKAATDLVAQSYGTTFGLEVMTVRPFNTIGPRQNDGSYAGLLPEVIRRVREGRPILINGDGEQTRDLTYVGDTVAGTLALARCDAALGKVVNLGTGQEASVNETVRLLLEALGAPDHPVEHGPPRPGDVRRLIADVTVARELVSFEPSVTLGDALQRTVEWYAQSAVSA